MITMKSWMKDKILLLLLLSIPSFSFSMEEGENSNVNTPRLFGTSIKDMEHLFENAPLKAKKIVNHLNNPNYLKDDECQYIFFVGVPGTGKSITAKAIAHKTGWRPLYYSPDDLLRKDRHATTERLSAVLHDAVKDNVSTLVIIDELNQLLEKYESAHHDTDATSKALWTFLDKQGGNRRFFLIGIMNRAHKLPPQIKSRMLSRCIEFYPPQDNETRKVIFLNKLLGEGITLSKEGEEYVDKNIKKLDGYVGRDFKEFALATKWEAASEEPTVTITKEHLENAAREIESAKKLTHYDDKEEETEEERQERHFQKNLALQDEHFVQQQLMSLATIRNQKTYYRYKGDSLTKTFQDINEKGLHQVLSYMSPNQWNYYFEMNNRKQEVDRQRVGKIFEKDHNSKKEAEK